MAQHYISEGDNEYVIRGNNAMLKCKIPSFVADFVQIIAWVDSDGQEYTPQTTSAHGKIAYWFFPTHACFFQYCALRLSLLHVSIQAFIH